MDLVRRPWRVRIGGLESCRSNNNLRIVPILDPAEDDRFPPFDTEPGPELGLAPTRQLDPLPLEDLATLLEREAAHHGIGIVLFNQEQPPTLVPQQARGSEH